MRAKEFTESSGDYGNIPTGPSPQLIPFPQGTTMVDVSDIYDWYKLGMVISDLDDADPRKFNQGAPHTILAFGSEEEEHKMLPLLKRLGLGLHDIDKPEDVQKAYRAKDALEGLEENFAEGRKKHKRKSGYAAYGPGPYGGYGYYAGYSGDSGEGGSDGGGESIKNEAFDQPYKLKWEGGDYGDVDAIARMDDGNYLSIMFNKGFSQDTKEEAWSVEFYRNNSQEVTGEGDAQRVFATVLSAIQTFIKKYKPNRVIFSASKEVEQGQNAQSRARLYDSLVQRYAKAWGFRAFRADTGNKVIYELSRIKPIVAKPVAENFADGKRPQDKGDSKRHGVPTKASVSTLRKVAKQGGRKGQLAHWMANMKSGRSKKK